ncbi:hypothetical protein B0A58_04755 [Flavobacterium branchiophilum NBRC 15030 = ATCC 35035]|uniref:Ribosomal RNA adenine dimethylase n=1 Tax=Flavobacterium branchiophilum TaxID=55197 RepID=A0A2H3KRJ6_9FLAO|nr:rRNA adenine N-6-methyltransferase family protein [Flavobacterium branchiophilum]OXA78055.1 hypothetical protein B0A58_04755 [Flavobacterium branchiophilum NBRC 15030 = ATCC 35035]PDS24631.1 hypothetical protein B0A77_07590 [Flavobacterium branchiophilum]TQM41270.1 ribosomal RNA adenine dimethylase [Flavobacterium branchiophilum]GEM54856.1 hypothetical protein FB1_10770 [Flavobacterium branchiophilum NBRC 15030 = ATCC 35035]
MSYWEDFWKDYRKKDIKNEDDLFYQVGKTFQKMPISAHAFDKIINDIIVSLQLEKEDVLMEICCGNGLITKKLSEKCKNIYAFDFTEHLIATAQEFKSADNIVYKTGNAKENFFNLFDFKNKPNKFLLNDSLAYFEPFELHAMIDCIQKQNSDFVFYVTNIPSDERKYHFYNTPERVQFYEEKQRQGDISNNGMGRWWTEQELITIANDLNISYKIQIPDTEITNFRINILFYSDK